MHRGAVLSRATGQTPLSTRAALIGRRRFASIRVPDATAQSGNQGGRRANGQNAVGQPG